MGMECAMAPNATNFSAAAVASAYIYIYI